MAQLLRRKSSFFSLNWSRPQAEEDFMKLKEDWLNACKMKGLSIPSKAKKEFKKRIANASSKNSKSKLNLSNCGLEDNHVICLFEQIKDSLIISKLELVGNRITSMIFSELRNVLASQIVSLILIPTDLRSDRAFLGDVVLDESLLQRANHYNQLRIQEINDMIAILKWANAQALIRNKYKEAGSPDTLDKTIIRQIWMQVVTNDEQDLLSKFHQRYAYSTVRPSYDQLEQALLSALATYGIISLISDREYARVNDVLTDLGISERLRPFGADQTPASIAIEPVAEVEASLPYSPVILNQPLATDLSPPLNSSPPLKKESLGAILLSTPRSRKSSPSKRSASESARSTAEPVELWKRLDAMDESPPPSPPPTMETGDGINATTDILLLTDSPLEGRLVVSPACLVADDTAMDASELGEYDTERDLVSIQDNNCAPEAELSCFRSTQSTPSKRGDSYGLSVSGRTSPTTAATDRWLSQDDSPLISGSNYASVPSPSPSSLPQSRSSSPLPSLIPVPVTPRGRLMINTTPSSDLHAQSRVSPSPSPLAAGRDPTQINNFSAMGTSVDLSTTFEKPPKSPHNASPAPRYSSPFREAGAQPTTPSSLNMSVDNRSNSAEKDRSAEKGVGFATSSSSPSLLSPSLVRSPAIAVGDASSPNNSRHPSPSKSPLQHKPKSPVNRLPAVVSKADITADTVVGPGLVSIDLSLRSLTTSQSIRAVVQHSVVDIASVVLLQQNCIDELSVFAFLSSFPELNVLNISHNALSGRLPQSMPPLLVRLNISHNRLTDLSALLLCTELEFLDASHNCVKNLIGLPPKLKYIDLSHNQIANQLNLRVLAPCANLSTFYIHDNPGFSGDIDYRSVVSLTFPLLEVLDGFELSRKLVASRKKQKFSELPLAKQLQSSSTLVNGNTSTTGSVNKPGIVSRKSTSPMRTSAPKLSKARSTVTGTERSLSASRRVQEERDVSRSQAYVQLQSKVDKQKMSIENAQQAKVIGLKSMPKSDIDKLTNRLAVTKRSGDQANTLMALRKSASANGFGSTSQNELPASAILARLNTSPDKLRPSSSLTATAAASPARTRRAKLEQALYEVHEWLVMTDADISNAVRIFNIAGYLLQSSTWDSQLFETFQSGYQLIPFIPGFNMPSQVDKATSVITELSADSASVTKKLSDRIQELVSFGTMLQDVHHLITKFSQTDVRHSNLNSLRSAMSILMDTLIGKFVNDHILAAYGAKFQSADLGTLDLSALEDFDRTMSSRNRSPVGQKLQPSLKTVPVSANIVGDLSPIHGGSVSAGSSVSNGYYHHSGGNRDRRNGNGLLEGLSFAPDVESQSDRNAMTFNYPWDNDDAPGLLNEWEVSQRMEDVKKRIASRALTDNLGISVSRRSKTGKSAHTWSSVSLFPSEPQSQTLLQQRAISAPMTPDAMHKQSQHAAFLSSLLPSSAIDAAQAASPMRSYVEDQPAELPQLQTSRPRNNVDIILSMHPNIPPIPPVSSPLSPPSQSNRLTPLSPQAPPALPAVDNVVSNGGGSGKMADILAAGMQQSLQSGSPVSLNEIIEDRINDAAFDVNHSQFINGQLDAEYPYRFEADNDDLSDVGSEREGAHTDSDDGGEREGKYQYYPANENDSNEGGGSHDNGDDDLSLSLEMPYEPPLVSVPAVDVSDFQLPPVSPVENIEKFVEFASLAKVQHTAERSSAVASMNNLMPVVNSNVNSSGDLLADSNENGQPASQSGLGDEGTAKESILSTRPQHAVDDDASLMSRISDANTLDSQYSATSSQPSVKSSQPLRDRIQQRLNNIRASKSAGGSEL